MLAGKVGKADKLLEEIGKEAENAPIAESKRQETAANIKTTQKTISEPTGNFPEGPLKEYQLRA
ncbi:MAG TPA: hypothetical protein VGB32_04990 [Candidatus Bathyarchaeia archaeon]